ncbi:PTS fructose transporter subunit IIABC [Pantoea sp. A4]|uniref:PTS fructose transporter subunit IIABC n=1 Tax=Pantoea sp. A4 TaxID=1225184 RepID=UPI000364E7AE|nr:fructose-specific PTS transporter subunit EIIC [Pantoea sp. A4]
MINTLLSKELIHLNLKAQNKADLLREMALILRNAGKVADENQFLKDVLSREEQGCTGFEEGIAIPHAKSRAVTAPAVAIGVSRSGIDYGAEDGELSHYFFMIASPDNADDTHIQILAQLASRFVEERFIKQLSSATSPEEVLALFQGQEEEAVAPQQSRGFLIGVTGCPTGIAHTYLAAEALEKGARELGYDILVETNGSIGVRNSPTGQQIAQAEAIIVSSDKPIDTDRFAGKKVIYTSVKAPIRGAREVINQALAAPIWQPESKPGKSTNSLMDSAGAGKNIYRSMMNGVSHMIPFVVTGGLMIALSLTIGGVPGPHGLVIPEGSIWNTVLSVGAVAFQLMIPVLSAYIAYAIAERPGLAPGFIGGWIANTGSFYGAAAGTGFIGAILAGFIVGYAVRWLARREWHKVIQPLVPILIAPLLGTILISGLFIFVIGAPIADLMQSLNKMLVSLSGGSLVLLGIVIGGMAGFDMGGPFNKVAFLFCLGMMTSGHPEYLGAIACAIPVAPLGMGIASLVARKSGLFTPEEHEAGKAAIAMGMMGISEGAIPFAARDPLTVIPANVVGSMLASVLAFQIGITNNVAHGGPVVALLGAMNKPIFAFSIMLLGAMLTAVVAISLKYIRSRKQHGATAQPSAISQKAITR